MNLINAPFYVQLPLRAIAPLAGHFPKKIMALKYKRWSGMKIDWNSPKNLQEYFLKEMMDAAADPERLKVYADLADKVAVRGFVAGRVGEEALTKLYGVWERPGDIDFGKLPVPCVIKTNNGCGTNIVIRTRQELDPEKIRKTLKRWLKFPYGQISGQPHYSAIKPLILAEEYLEQNPGSDELPYDYKFFCFNGEPRFILFYSGRKVNGHITYNQVYDMNWNVIPDSVRKPVPTPVERPAGLEKMTRLARKLSRGFKVVRVDFYCIGDRPVFGEMTFSPDVVTNFTPDFLDEQYRRL